MKIYLKRRKILGISCKKERKTGRRRGGRGKKRRGRRGGGGREKEEEERKAEGFFLKVSGLTSATGCQDY